MEDIINSIESFARKFNGDCWAMFEAGITLVTLGFVVKSFFNNRKQNEKINIFILEKKEKIPVPFYLLRKHFTRAEVKGVLREVHKPISKEVREYEIEYMQKPEFMIQIQKVYDGKQNDFIIPIIEKDVFYHTLNK